MGVMLNVPAKMNRAQRRAVARGKAAPPPPVKATAEVECTLENEPADFPCPPELRDRSPSLVKFTQGNAVMRKWFPMGRITPP